MHKICDISLTKSKFVQNSGFTIIEVALVLAVAGLIFLVVFLALPALQRSQRDTARRQDVAKAIVAIQQFYADGGDPRAIPSNPNHIAKDWSDTFSNVPVLGPYLMSAGISSNIPNAKIFPYPACTGSWAPSNQAAYDVEIFIGCKNESKDANGTCIISPAGMYDVVVAVRLEAGSSTHRNYCANAGR